MKHCSLLTSAGSKAKSWFLYLRTKGAISAELRPELCRYLGVWYVFKWNNGCSCIVWLSPIQLEEAVRELGFPYLSIFRPGVLDRGAAQRRFGERLVSE